MARRLKSTPFARFLVAMLFIIPLAYIGASYYNGQDPIQTIKNKLNIESSSDESGSTVSDRSDDVYDLRKEIDDLKERIKELELENAELTAKVRRLEMNQ